MATGSALCLEAASASWEWCRASKFPLLHPVSCSPSQLDHSKTPWTTLPPSVCAGCAAGIAPIPAVAPVGLGWWSPGSPGLTVPPQSSDPLCSCVPVLHQRLLKNMLTAVFHSLLLCIHTGLRFICFLANIFLYNSEIFILSNKRQ